MPSSKIVNLQIKRTTWDNRPALHQRLNELHVRFWIGWRITCLQRYHVTAVGQETLPQPWTVPYLVVVWLNTSRSNPHRSKDTALGGRPFERRTRAIARQMSGQCRRILYLWLQPTNWKPFWRMASSAHYVKHFCFVDAVFCQLIKLYKGVAYRTICLLL